MSNSAEKTDHKDLLPIFDKVENLEFNTALPQHLRTYKKFARDYIGAHAFLYAYKDNSATFNAYRREVERLLHWSWQKAKKSIYKLRRPDIELYIKFCQKPPKRWIGLTKPARFIEKDGERQPNPAWRPFVATVSKRATRIGDKPSKDQYALSAKAVKEIFAVLSTFYNFLIQDEYTEVNPILQVRQKSRFIRKTQSKKKIRRLSNLQWSYVIETAQLKADTADCNGQFRFERELFMLTILYAMYLRVSELIENDRWKPKMGDFYRDHDGNWWFTTVGKGNKERQIAVSDAMLKALKRWRKHLALTPLPSVGDASPLLPKMRGQGGLASTNQVRQIVQICFDAAIARMRKDGFIEEADGLESATVHWLRHTGISDDVKRRPREHVRDDAGHSSSQTTDRYIDIDLKERYRSAKKKPIVDGDG